MPVPRQSSSIAALPANRWNPRTTAGYTLIGSSFALWLPLPLLPFLPLSMSHRAGLGGGLVIAAEFAFWAGLVLAGPEAARRVRGAVGRFRRRRRR